MTKLNTALIVTLVISVAFNVYQYLSFNEKGALAPMPAPANQGKSKVPTRLQPGLTDEDSSPATDQPFNDHDSHFDTDTPAQAPKRFEADRREAYLAQTRRWLAAQEYAKLDAFFPLYLRQYPQDIEFLLLEAEYIAHTHLLSDAIIHYHSMLNLPLSNAQQAQVQNTITRLTNNTITQLKQANSWDILAQFVEPLLQVSPTDRGLILALATAYARQQQAGLMENALASIRYDDPQAMEIRQIIQQNNDDVIANNDGTGTGSADSHRPNTNTPAGGMSIELQKYGDQYVVETRLSAQQVHFLIDTGASTTAISRQKFKALFKTVETKFVGQFNVQTANGVVRSPMYQFASLEIAQAKVRNINVMVLPLDELGHSDGLLGMNFLREFDFRIDQNKALLHLQ
jgi:clan AA aspartic protease (TIGR02281 family)